MGKKFTQIFLKLFFNQFNACFRLGRGGGDIKGLIIRKQSILRKRTKL